MADDPAPLTVSPRRDLLARLCLVAALNVALGLVVSHGYVTVSPPGATVLGWTAMGLAWLSTLASLAAVALLVFLAPAALLPRRWMGAVLAIAGFGMLQVVLYGDVVAFGLYRMHYNQMVWDLLTTPGAGDSVRLGWGTVTSIVLVVGGILLAETAIAWLALHPRAARFTGRRWLLGLLGGVLAVVLADKTLYAWGNLTSRTEITRVERHFPLYQRLTLRRFAMRRGWISPESDNVVIRAGSSGLAYPRVPIALPDDPRRLNVVILAIEGARADMLDPAVMPRLHAFAQTHTWGRNHFSGGNATRFGIFSLLYGIHATYWQQVIAERQGPFLIHALKQFGYRITVQACTDLNFPEFRQTAFVEVPEAITDQWPDIARVERDRVMTDNLVRAIGEAGEQPFFTFGFYDAPHANYIYPPEHERFTPVQSEHGIDFIKIAGSCTVENLLPLANRYRNSLHYIDAQIGRLLDELEQRRLLDRTLVFVVGDHGEEFGELGYYGHNGTFSRYQIQTLMVANIPGLAPGPIERPTSHIDVVPTILAALGFTAPVEDYSNGLRLDRPSERDHVMAASWDSLALIDAQTVMVRGLGANLTRDILGHDYHPVADPDAAFAVWRPRLLSLIQSMRAFSR